jgi:hypothetical protein
MNKMKQMFYLIIAIVFLTSCGDSDSLYITSIDNNSDYEIVVKFSEDSTILCLPNQETIIEEDYGGSITELSCMTPYIFSNNDAEIIIEDGNKTLAKDVTDDNNWTCSGEEDWSLIMVGNYYSEIMTTFTVSNEDIKDAE